MKTKVQVPIRYIPNSLSRKDKQTQQQMLLQSRKLYKKGKYFTRKSIPTFKSKQSKHISKALALYKINDIKPSKELARKTGCSMNALEQIVKKGEGAYYSSGSRPNQTAQSWGLARLASVLTAGKAGAVDFSIIEKGCEKKKAFQMAVLARKKYGLGHSHTKRTFI